MMPEFGMMINFLVKRNQLTFGTRFGSIEVKKQNKNDS
ncbi:hypothetical protein PLO_0233 [Pediococcus acidilactici NGRI 0510Q]|nr:hypothetical protein PLO_0233 [Pediococcus acidilactici NGRI 0510Q]